MAVKRWLQWHYCTYNDYTLLFLRLFSSSIFCNIMLFILYSNDVILIMFYHHVFCCSYFHPEWSLSISSSLILVPRWCDTNVTRPTMAHPVLHVATMLSGKWCRPPCLTSLKRCNRHRPRTGNTWLWAVAARNVLEHFPSSLLQHPKPQSLHRKVGCQAWGPGCY